MRGLSATAMLGALIVGGSLFAREGDSATSPEVPSAKQTVLNLYLTAKDAGGKWKADSENVKIIDVRTPEEYIFVGHPTMAWNIPLLLLERPWDPQQRKPVMRPNADFLTQVKRMSEPSDTLLMICRSGKRSASAADILAKTGYKKVYNVIDGVEGDLVKDPHSVFYGKHMWNGWKNSGLPWTYDVDPKLIVLPLGE